MGMILAVIGFTLVTGLCVMDHLRRREKAPRTAAPTGPPCPRCGVPGLAGGTFCPGCGVPLQVYDIVAAPVAAPRPEGAESDGPLHAVVRADVCVGCGTCVPVCPEKGAITLDGKLAVIHTSLCKGHGACAEACPMGAILMAAGGAVHRVQVPDVNSSFMSNVDGVHIVGELGGRGLIKNAINEGKIAVEGITRELGPASPNGNGNGDGAPLDIVVVGGGPAGMSAGLEAHRRGYRYVVLEQGELADTIRKYPRDKLILGEPVRIPLYGDLWVADASKETLIRVWETIAVNTGLRLRTNHRVDDVRRAGEHIEVCAGGRVFTTRRVILAMGRRGTPRRLGVPGEELGKVYYEIVEMDLFRGKRVLVVGGGDSAIESVLGAANQEGAEVTLSYRGDDFRRIKDRNREKLENTVREGKVRVLLGSHVRAIEEGAVTLETRGGEQRLPNDYVIIRIGGEPPFPFLERIGVRMVVKEVPLPGSEEVVHAAI